MHHSLSRIGGCALSGPILLWFNGVGNHIRWSGQETEGIVAGSSREAEAVAAPVCAVVAVAFMAAARTWDEEVAKFIYI